jgi:hypothetical protein
VTDPTVDRPASVHIRTREHQLTRDEVVPLFYWQVRQRWQNWSLPLVGASLAVAGAAVLVLDPADEVAWVVMLTLGLVILVIFAVLVPLTPNRIWRRVGKQFEVRTLEIEDEGIIRHTALNDTTMRWPMFSNVKLRNDLYLLVVGKGPGFFIIPRRAFLSRSDEVTFYELAQRSTSAPADSGGA